MVKIFLSMILCLFSACPTGRLSINLVVLVVRLLLDGENFLVHVFVPVLGMPLEETLCSCPSDLLQSRSK